MKGKFISMEGLDGSGKSTQWEMLGRWLKAQGYQVLLTREPGGTVLGEEIRELLLKPGRHIGALSEALLYAASRAALVEEALRPALAAGQVVLCDRFLDSSLAYQGYGRGLGLDLVRDLNREATQGLEPGLTLLLDVEATDGLARVRRKPGGPDRLEVEAAAFYLRVRQGYLELARLYPGRIRLIPPGSVEETSRLVLALVREFLERGEG